MYINFTHRKMHHLRGIGSEGSHAFSHSVTLVRGTSNLSRISELRGTLHLGSKSKAYSLGIV